MDPPWKVMNPASFSTALIILMFAGLCKGLPNQNLGYNLTVPASVSVQRSLCVHIPCSFTYDHTARTNSEKLYGYWFQNNDRNWHNFASGHQAPGILVATNDERQRLKSEVKDRFQFTGKQEEGNCSFIILNAKSGDAGEYYFRIEDNSFRYTFTTNHFRIHRTLRVHVTEFTEKPQIWASSAVLFGKEAVYTCLALGICTKIDPGFLWDSRLTGSSTIQWSQQHSNGSWTYGSNFTFTPSLNDQGKSLTCWFKYPLTWVSNSIHVDVADPPKTVEIFTNATEHGHLASCSQEANGDLDAAVAQEGESISLHCEAESRPNPTLSWRKGNDILSCTRQGMECVLLLPELRPEDAGKYQCQAETPYGSATKTLWLCVQSSHNNIWGSSAILFLIILCLYKVLFCFVFFSAIWFSNQRKAPLREKR